MSAMSPISRGDVTTLAFALQKDNSKYLDRVNQADLQKKFIRPTSTVVLTQDPPPGTQVPVGTQINLTLVAKGDIPTISLGAVQVVTKKWARAGDVQQAIDAAGDAVKAVFEKEPDYERLGAGDKQLVDGFVRQQLGDVGAADVAQAYGDMAFMYEL
jgi:hypothetical protein